MKKRIRKQNHYAEHRQSRITNLLKFTPKIKLEVNHVAYTTSRQRC